MLVQAYFAFDKKNISKFPPFLPSGCALKNVTNTHYITNLLMHSSCPCESNTEQSSLELPAQKDCSVSDINFVIKQAFFQFLATILPLVATFQQSSIHPLHYHYYYSNREGEAYLKEEKLNFYLPNCSSFQKILFQWLIMALTHPIIHQSASLTKFQIQH